MQGLYDIINALIPYIPWFASVYIVHTVYKSRPKETEITCGDKFSIKTRM